MTDNEYRHDFEDPMSHLNGLEMALLAARPPADLRCPHCHITTHMLPMTDTAWGLEVFHEPDCPSHEDNQPAADAGPSHQ